MHHFSTSVESEFVTEKKKKDEKEQETETISTDKSYSIAYTLRPEREEKGDRHLAMAPFVVWISGGSQGNYLKN